MISTMWLLFSGLVIGWLVGFAFSTGLLTWLLLLAALCVLAVTVYRSRSARFVRRPLRIRPHTRQ